MQGPRLYRFFNYEQIIYLPAPTGGWAPDLHPLSMPLNQAQQLDNFLIRPGKIIGRGGFGTVVDLSAHSPVAPVGAVMGPSSSSIPMLPWFLVAQLHSNSGVEGVANWDAPGIRNAFASNLMRGTGTGIFFNQATQVLSTPAMQPSIGPRWINFDGLLYGIAYDDLPGNTTATDVNNNYIVWKTKLLTMPMSTLTAPTITVNSNAPQGAFDVIGYQQRIWLLGGVDIPGGGTTHSATKIFFTNPGASGVGAASADWKDPVAGTTNQIEMDQNSNDYGVGFAVVRNGLLIFRKHSVWLLRGTTTANYTLIPLSRDIGCVDARAIVEVEQGVYFLSHKGLYFCNGTTITDMSGPMKHTLTQAIQNEQMLRSTNLGNSAGTNVGGGYEHMQLTSAGDLLITIGIGPGNNPGALLRTRPVLTVLFTPSVKGGAWTRITSQVFGLENSYSTQSAAYAAPQFVTNVTGYPAVYSIGDKYIMMLDTIGGPLSESLIQGNVGAPVTGAYDQIGPINANTSYSIPMSWTTRAVPVIQNATRKRQYGQAKRAFLDYVFAYGGNNTPSGGFTVVPVGLNYQFTPLPNAPSFQVPVSSLNTNHGWFGNFTNLVPQTFIARENMDFWTELTDLAFNVSFSTPNQSNTTISTLISEIYGIGIEFQGAREEGHG